MTLLEAVTEAISRTQTAAENSDRRGRLKIYGKLGAPSWFEADGKKVQILVTVDMKPYGTVTASEVFDAGVKS